MQNKLKTCECPDENGLFKIGCVNHQSATMNELKTFLEDTDPIYRAMDSFLTEYTDIEGKPIFRSIERLNEDRQLFVEEMKKRDIRLVNKVLEIVKKNLPIAVSDKEEQFKKEIMDTLNDLTI